MSKEPLKHPGSKEPVLKDSKGRTKDHPNFDEKTAKPTPATQNREDAMAELSEAVADLATEVGGSQNKGSAIDACTSRVQEALRVYKEQI